jgi:hypothetical protein
MKTLREALRHLYYLRNSLTKPVRILKHDARLPRGEFDLNVCRPFWAKMIRLSSTSELTTAVMTLDFLRLFANSRVCAFEPDQRALDR